MRKTRVVQENNASQRKPLAGTRLGGIDPHRRFLAAELDAAGRADLVPVLSALARIHFGGRCARAGANGNFDPDAFTQKLFASLFNLRAGVVAI